MRNISREAAWDALRLAAGTANTDMFEDRMLLFRLIANSKDKHGKGGQDCRMFGE
jgi:hypothetical protein